MVNQIAESIRDVTELPQFQIKAMAAIENDDC